MICALCQQERKLCNSHIFPEFLYGSLYDSKHRAVNAVIKSDSAKELSPTYIQKGLREKLLCQKCEGVLSRYENHFALVTQNRQKYHLAPLLCEGAELQRLGGLDYSHFKLFCLSILWRMSVSKMSGFRNIDLGSHNQRIGQMLLTENAGSVFDYPFFCRPLLFRGESLSAILYGKEEKSHAIRIYTVGYAACEWRYFVGSHLPPEFRKYEDLFLKEEGELLFAPSSNFEETEFCTKVLNLATRC